MLIPLMAWLIVKLGESVALHKEFKNRKSTQAAEVGFLMHMDLKTTVTVPHIRATPSKCVKA